MSPGIKKYILPISVPIWGRIWRDYWHITLICGGTLVGFHWLAITFLPKYNMKYRLYIIDNLPGIVKAMIGPDLMQMTSKTSIAAFIYLHPVSLLILVAFAIMMPSWMLVGQIDRGTVELLLATPVSRKKIIFTTFLAGIVGGIVLVASMLLGSWIGIQQTHLTEIRFDRICVVALNLYMLYLLILSGSIFFSAITSIRGMAVGWTIALGVIAYLLHFLAEWWTWVGKIAFLGPLYYFRPIKIAAGNYTDLPKDLTILVAASAVLLVISMIWFSRRDIAVV
ncbi:MAG: ABC transporter permease subunit [Phycisphaerae bacterium]